MVGVSEGIVVAHKHMFTDFGMDLRKSQLNDLALTSFRRALELSPDDSHALFNVGRALYELGKYREADEYLDRALNLEPDLACARRLKKKFAPASVLLSPRSNARHEQKMGFVSLRRHHAGAGVGGGPCVS